MAQSFSSSENQGVIALRVGNQPAGTEITVADSAGKILLSHKPELPFAVVILSCPEMTKDGTYTVKIGNSVQEIIAE